jgi:hypothetical protein
VAGMFGRLPPGHQRCVGSNDDHLVGRVDPFGFTPSALCSGVGPMDLDRVDFASNDTTRNSPGEETSCTGVISHSTANQS